VDRVSVAPQISPFAHRDNGHLVATGDELARVVQDEPLLPPHSELQDHVDDVHRAAHAS
jgi:hypothetical protein